MNGATPGLWRALRRLAHALAWQGTLGVLLLLSCLAILAWQAATGVFAPVAPPVVTVTTGPDRPVAATVSPARELFVPAAQMPDVVRHLFEVAAMNQLYLDTGRYRWTRTQGGAQIYSMSLPLKGNYGQIRAFLAQAMQDEPRLALESLEFRRDDVTVEFVTVQAGLAVFVETAP